MSKTEDKANDIIRQLTIDNKKVAEVKEGYPDEEDWIRICNKAYSLYLDQEKKQRELDLQKPNYSASSNSTIDKIIALNEKLAEYALGIPITTTGMELESYLVNTRGLPDTEEILFKQISSYNMSPQFRAMQKNGRFKHYTIFREFEQIIDAALLCYYRGNYVSCFLTLVPVVEGVILRWSKHDNTIDKLNFENHRSFFKKGARRNPCPGNVLFYEVFSKICDNILNKHLYKPTTSGDSYGNFNRHLALHLLKTPEFGTRNNCIRLFMLLDFMTEIYWYEERFDDPRFTLATHDIKPDIDIYKSLMVEYQRTETAEKRLFK